MIVVGGDLGIINDLKFKKRIRMSFFKVEFMRKFSNNKNIFLGMLL